MFFCLPEKWGKTAPQFEFLRAGCENPGASRFLSARLPAMTKQKSTAVATRRAPRKRTRQSPAAVAEPSLYSVHPGVRMMQKWIAELKPKTGRALDEWLRHIRAAGPADEAACRKWLQDSYSLGANSAWWLAERAAGNSPSIADDDPQTYLAACPQLVDDMYAGPKAALRPLHDKLIELTRALGEVRICPCKTVVPLYRRHVFAQIKPATSKRIDLGLALGDEPFTARLVDTGGRAKRDRITHRVSLTTLTDIDLQVNRWLKEAYGRDG